VISKLREVVSPETGATPEAGLPAVIPEREPAWTRLGGSIMNRAPRELIEDLQAA
jgi:hypothetical protein